jgi:hypothetical protein
LNVLEPKVAENVFHPDNGLVCGGGGGTHVVDMVVYGALVVCLVTVPMGCNVKEVKKVTFILTYPSFHSC